MLSQKKVTLVCNKCNSRNYSKNKSNTTRLVLKKHCNKCMMHTYHKEDK